ncbi:MULTISPECIES: NAD(P)/FAD-dependent oxidoreductase [Thermoactinomyces]|jgi:predicted Rossmann fold flavoprotein|uniref:NAD(P)/FAD-dependent oxidoreductase n=1 Tax=Thermoactinomyces daqus TaxID=1329516 RepID=A0A7W1XBX5_9BACL|nr:MULTISPECIES: NAD(P)/FAD-dependent oxidoreductase [Thermoactinomyces]MBA4543728.1 NAD(P)/FAD-dependent oxidoreductase [Thermoactinomyces daqus]MBH8597509.1 NAD(P)/FAD-dependent oxidoreductase [Thermoactinomyces sp. CICC 10523]MBH8608541.1 NAD(P)/FAD-dependent oxidoreductase [Thermoactinomyces sp. CICC 10521]
MNYDVIVIGGGPAGLMASASAGMHGARVLLLDKGEKLGKKLAISGGGRCNVTNNKEIDELIRNIPGNGRFLYSVFSIFNNRDIIRFFEDLGVSLKEEDNGRMFPVTDSAKSVVQAFIKKVKAVGTEIRVNLPVKRILYEGGKVKGVECRNGQSFFAPAVIVATGGKAASHTGSTGDGYAWATEAGHTITELFPTEVPLTSAEPLIKNKILQGLSLRDVVLTVYNPKGKKLVEHRGDVLFTHFGLSGPAALRCSQFVVKALKKFGTPSIPLAINLFPDVRPDQLEQEWGKVCRKQPKKTVRNALKPFLPDRMIPVLTERAEISGDLTCSHLSREQLEKLCQTARHFTLAINGTLSLEKAFVTGGGVHVKEIDPKTMQSKKMQGLYFCGEILDIHGYTGGYNITAATCTGYVAGKSAAEQVIGQRASLS